MFDTDDRGLVAAACAGDASAFGELVARHYRMVYGAALASVGRRDAAEDLAQEAFLSAWVNRSKLRTPGAFPMWIRAIARNLATSWLRSNLTRARLVERYLQQDEPSPNPAPERLGAAETHAEVAEALQALPPTLRETLVLYYLEEQSVADTARALGISPNAVKVRLYQGRRRLRAHLEAQVERGLVAQEAPQPEQARKRILAGLAVGPALPELAARVSGRTLPLLAGHVWHAGVAGLGPALLGGAVMSAKSVAVGVGIVVALFIAAWVGAPVQRGAADAPATENEANDAQAPAAEDAASESAAALETFSERKPAAAPVAQEDAAPAVVLAAAPSGTTEPDPPVGPTSVAGTVTDPSGGPLAGADVFLMPEDLMTQLNADMGEATPLARFRSATDARGGYAFEAVPTDQGLCVVACAEGHRPGYKGFRLEAGERVEGLDLALEPGLVLEGLVTDDRDQPVPGAVVRAWGLAWNSPDGGGTVRGATLGATVTDAEGRFALGFEREGSTNIDVAAGDKGRANFQDIAVREDDPVTLVLPRPAGLFGRVTHADGSPAKGIRLEAWRGLELRAGGASSSTAYMAAFAVAGEDGHYEMPGLQPAVPWNMEAVESGGETLAKDSVAAFDPGERREWNLRLEDAMGVRGRVTAIGSGKPVPDMAVRALRDGEVVGTGDTDAAGLFRLKLFQPGAYVICATGPAGSPDESTLAHAREAHVRSGETAEVDLQVPAPFSMTVRAVDPYGNPVSGARVDVDWTRDGRSVNGYGIGKETDADGRLAWGAFLPDTEGWFELKKRGYARTETPHRRGQSGEALPEDTVVMLPDCGIRGRLVDPEGRPLANTQAWVLAREQSGYERGFNITVGTDGSFKEPEGLPSGSVTFELMAALGPDGTAENLRRYTWTSDAIECPAGEVLDLGDIVCAPGG